MSNTFNYRVFKEQEEITPNNWEDVLTIRTVYYDDACNPVSYGDIAAYPVGNTFEELTDEISRFEVALTKPILSKEDFK